VAVVPRFVTLTSSVFAETQPWKEAGAAVVVLASFSCGGVDESR